MNSLKAGHGAFLNEETVVRVWISHPPNFRTNVVKMQRIKNLAATQSSFALLAIFLTVLFLYLPNSQGIFLLDDWPSLSDLNNVRANGFSWSSILAYTLGGSGFPGRPISLFSFAVQAESWPDHPEHFKYVNVIIHSFNSVLVYLLSSNLLHRNSYTARYAVVGGIWVAAVWALHPMFASSVLYVVQRMTLLSAFFCLLSLYFYILIHESLTKAPTSLYSALLVVCAYFGVLLGVLAKENAIAISLILFAAEVVVFNRSLDDKFYKLRLVMLVFPFVLLVVYLGLNFDRIILEPYSFRDFSLVERVLTQFGVMFDYCKRLIIISPQEYGLFHDSYPVSTVMDIKNKSYYGFFIFVFLLLVVVLVKDSLIKFGVIFFLVGHILESTIIPLEIYFEHRNYFPAIGLFLAIFVAIVRLNTLLKEKEIVQSGVLGGVATAGLLAIVVFSGWSEAKLWSEPMAQAHVWYERDRTSLRALGHYGALLEQSGNIDGAFKLYEEYYQNYNDFSVALMMMHAACTDGRFVDIEKERALQQATEYKSSYAPLLFSLYIIMKSQKGMCDSADLDFVMAGLDRLLENKNYFLKTKDIYVVKSKYYIGLGDYDYAYRELNEAFRISPSLDVLVGQAQIASISGDKDLLFGKVGEINDFCKAITRECVKYDSDIRELNKAIGEFKSNQN